MGSGKCSVRDSNPQWYSFQGCRVYHSANRAVLGMYGPKTLF
jgi:hypothetical protein